MSDKKPPSMQRLTEKLSPSIQADTILTLPLEKRIKSRLRVTLDNGEEAGLFLERGDTLRDGDVLRSETGLLVQIRSAAEMLSCIECKDALLLARACYHLGNRHVPLHIEVGRVCYQHDHVLDEMSRGLGLTVQVIEAPFEPEPGAYSGGGHHSHSSHEHNPA